MSRLLITGGAGFIGGNFTHYWHRRHPEDRLVVLDALTYAGCRESLNALEPHPGFRFVHGSINDQPLVESLLREEQLDIVVHFAAESHVDRSITGPDPFIETNVLGTHTLLKAARAVWLSGSGLPHRFHHVSTDEVYGSLGPDDPPFTESSPYAPNSPYAASKAASDHLVRAYHHTYGLQTTVSHCSNNYGPFQFPEKFIPLMVIHLLTGQPLPLYGDGGNVRDWLHVDDHSRAIETILRQGQPGQTYNVGGNNEQTNVDLLHLLCRVVDEVVGVNPDIAARFPQTPASRGEQGSSLITPVTDRPGHDRRYAINADKIRRDLGFTPLTPFIEGLHQTLIWYLDNEPWWRHLKNRRRS